ncbi:hypothetical protein ANCCAN_14962, partial [Ancylostoma caninum]
MFTGCPHLLHTRVAALCTAILLAQVHRSRVAVPPPANVTAPAQPQETPAGEPAPEAVAHVEEEHNSDGDDDPFAYSSHNEDMATDSTQDSSDDDATDSSSASEDADEKNRREIFDTI